MMHYQTLRTDLLLRRKKAHEGMSSKNVGCSIFFYFDTVFQLLNGLLRCAFLITAVVASEGCPQ